jgi:hypothetical protein
LVLVLEHKLALMWELDRVLLLVLGLDLILVSALVQELELE